MSTVNLRSVSLERANQLANWLALSSETNA